MSHSDFVPDSPQSFTDWTIKGPVSTVESISKEIAAQTTSKSNTEGIASNDEDGVNQVSQVGFMVKGFM